MESLLAFRSVRIDQATPSLLVQSQSLYADPEFHVFRRDGHGGLNLRGESGQEDGDCQNGGCFHRIKGLHQSRDGMRVVL